MTVTYCPYQLVFFELLGVDAVRVVNAAVILNDADALGAGAGQVTTAVQAHITEALNHNVLMSNIYRSGATVADSNTAHPRPKNPAKL